MIKCRHILVFLQLQAKHLHVVVAAEVSKVRLRKSRYCKKKSLII